MKNKRFWEIDFLRGVAIVLMILFHTVWALNKFDLIYLNQKTLFWQILQYFTASTFILLVGISLTLSFSRVKNKNLSFLLKKYFKRGLQIFALGLIVTLASYLFMPEGTIYFGILHFIGLSIILAFPFLRFKDLNLALGTLFLLVGLAIKNISISTPWLIWLGLKFRGFYTIDYFPLFPWFGLVLIGIFLGNSFYTNHTRNFKMIEKPNPTNLFCWLGKHSLKIYFLHAILIYSLIQLVKIF